MKYFLFGSLYLVCAYVTLVYIAPLFFVSHDWIGVYYPNGHALSKNAVISEPLESLDKCHEWVDSVTIPGNDDDDHECGYKCNPMDDTGILICKRTEE